MGDKTRGLYEKFKVTRRDGMSTPGHKHHGCQYFVLDLDCDKNAIPPLLFYAECCRDEYPLLAEDLDALAFKKAQELGIQLPQIKLIWPS